MYMSIKQLPNFITTLRVIGTMVLFFVKPFSVQFFVIYTLCGISDIVDGFIARKYDASSELGAKLDSVADLLFYSVMAIRIMPALVMVLTEAIWITIGIIVLLRIVSYTLAAIRYKCFASHHTYLNKLTGTALFALPYFIDEMFAIPYCIIGCTIAGIATIEELVMHIVYKEYHSDMRTLLKKEVKHGM